MYAFSLNVMALKNAFGSRRNNRLTLALFLATLALGVVVSGTFERRSVFAQDVISFTKLWITIETETGPHLFNVELAETGRQLARGLMGRQSLAVDAGMIFIYKRPHRVAMWMKDTLIPLDILFVGVDGMITSIIERATPMSLTTLRSVVPVRAVVEVNAGTVNRLRIKSGNRVIHRIFGNDQ